MKMLLAFVLSFALTNMLNAQSDSAWNQLWIDNSGNVLKLKGHFTNEQMVLKSELQKGVKVDWYYNQITWTPNEDGTVSQLWEIYDSRDTLLQTAFLGIYQSRKLKKEGEGRDDV